MQVLKFPHPKLFLPTKEVGVFTPELRVLLEAMWDTMVLAKGIGLAANQVDLDYRMFVMQGPNDTQYFLVNPYITNKSNGRVNLKEGCLSAPGEFLIIPDRAQWVQATYQDEYGEIHAKVFRDLYAVCVQHEIDHLEGRSHLQAKSLPREHRKQLAAKWGIPLK